MLSLLTRYLWPVVAAVIAALVVLVGLQTHRLSLSKAETEEVRQAWAADRARATAAALDESTKYRALESQMQAQQEKSFRDYQAAQSRNESRLAAARADTGRLRDQLSAYAANTGSPTPDTVAACDQRATTLGKLLEAALQSDADRTADAEAQSDAVRALLAAWPR